MSQLRNTMIEKISEKMKDDFNEDISELSRYELFNYIKENYVDGYTYFTVSTRIKYINATLNIFRNPNSFVVTEFGITMQGGNNITKDEIIEYINILENPQDQFIIYALFCGIYNNDAEELLTMTTDMIDLEKGIIKLKDRIIVMDSLMNKIVEYTLNETTYYIIDAGKTWTTTEFAFNTSSEYVIKQRPSIRNNNGVNCMSYNGFRTRMKSLLSYLDSDLSITDIVSSGYAYRISNELDKVSTQAINSWLRKNNIRCSDYKLRKIVNELYKK